MNAPKCYVRGCTNPVEWEVTNPSITGQMFLCDKDRWRVHANRRKRVMPNTISTGTIQPVPKPETLQITFKYDSPELADELRIARSEGEGITIRVGGKHYTVEVESVNTTADEQPLWLALGFSSEADMRAEDFQD